MSNALKPCPFCGGAEQEIIYQNGIDGIACISCLGCFGNCAGNSDLFAAKSWNTRPIEDALQSQIDQLKTQLSGITQYGSVDAAEKIDRLERTCATLTKERDEARGMLEADRDSDHETKLDEWAFLGSGGFDPPVKPLFPWENKTDE